MLIVPMGTEHTSTAINLKLKAYNIRTMEDANVIRPTKKQSELLGFIETFIKTQGYSPSYREIMKGLNYTSVATVSLHVNSLITRGHLRKRDRSARSLEVVEPSGKETSKSVMPKQLKTSEGKWLVDKVELFFKEIENFSCCSRVPNFATI